MNYNIAINNQQSVLPIDEDRLRRAIELVLSGENVPHAVISLAVVDHTAMHALNRRYLAHDWPTDVLSFVLEGDARLEGEVIVSAEMAADEAERFGWSAGEELLLYVVHGILHLVGYDDKRPELAAQMRAQETHYLQLLGTARPARGESARPVEGEISR